SSPRSLALLSHGMDMGHGQRRRDSVGAGGDNVECGPALTAPTVVDDPEDLRSHHAFELLLLGQKFEIGCLAVCCQRRISALHLECDTIKMGRGYSARQTHGDCSEFFRTGHRDLFLKQKSGALWPRLN